MGTSNSLSLNDILQNLTHDDVSFAERLCYHSIICFEVEKLREEIRRLRVVQAAADHWLNARTAATGAQKEFRVQLSKHNVYGRPTFEELQAMLAESDKAANEASLAFDEFRAVVNASMLPIAPEP